MKQLRPYQKDCKAAVYDKLRDHQSTLYVLATGLGKTEIFSSLVREQHGRVMVVAHRQELVEQAARRIEEVAGMECAIEMGMSWASDTMWGQRRCIIGSVQTLSASRGGRINRFDPKDFSLLILDECHHSTAASWRSVVDHFKTNPNLKIVGCTATPDRADEEALGQIFESIAYEYELADAIPDGWLVPIQMRQVFIESLDFAQIRTTAGDLNGADLERVMMEEKPLHAVADPLFKLADNRQTLVFASSVAHANRLCEILNRHRSGCAQFIDASTDKDIRRDMLDQFSRREFQFLCNCMIATEGWDCPAVEVVAMARPTKSRALYTQMVGRGTRALPGIVDVHDTKEARCAAITASAKPSVEIIDFVGNTGKHELISTIDILGGKYSPEVRAAVKAAAQDGELCTTQEALAREEKEQRAAAEAAQERQRRSIIKGEAKFTWQINRPFDVIGIPLPQPRGWDKPLTPQQRQRLEKAGWKNTDGLTEEAAKVMLAESDRRYRARIASPKQAAILKQNGLDPNMSREKAGAIMAVLAKHNWRPPAGSLDKFMQKEVTAEPELQGVPF